MYKPGNGKIWTGRMDANEGAAGRRWHQLVQCVNVHEWPPSEPDENRLVMLGFACDEGVRRNKGRTGAKEGPDALRKACANLANHFDENTGLFDAGNVICKGHELEGAQEELQSIITSLASKNLKTIVFGGGHEVAYPHFVGIRKAMPPDKTIGIVNIDAHFDLRLPEDGPSSGTPFYQISDFCLQNEYDFKYFVAGIQQYSNTKALFDRADALGVRYISAYEIMSGPSSESISKLTAFLKQVDHVYLTICLDVFDMAFAPGVSAPAVAGIIPGIALKLIQFIMDSGKLIAADIAELNPSLDQDGKTARLASRLVFELLTNWARS